MIFPTTILYVVVYNLICLLLCRHHHGLYNVIGNYNLFVFSYACTIIFSSTILYIVVYNVICLLLPRHHHRLYDVIGN